MHGKDFEAEQAHPIFSRTVIALAFSFTSIRPRIPCLAWRVRVCPTRFPPPFSSPLFLAVRNEQVNPGPCACPFMHQIERCAEEFEASCFSRMDVPGFPA